MNRSIVVTRYARALVKYTRVSGVGEIVCSEAEKLMDAMATMPDLKRMVQADNDVVSAFEKKKLLQTALGNTMSQELSRFLTLLNKNGRMNLVSDILRDYVDLYHRSMNIRKASLVVASEPSERLLQRLKALVKSKTGSDLIISVEVDPTILGGFIFDMDDSLLDASVKRQLDLIREQFIERNRRII